MEIYKQLNKQQWYNNKTEMDDDYVWKAWQLSFPLFEVQISVNKQQQSMNKFEPALCGSSF
jgi:hypothetical protein